MNDSSPVKLYYDNVAVFDAVPCPEPLVSRSDAVIYTAKKIGQTTSFTLEGNITGTNENDLFGSLIQNQNNLLSGFRKDFKNFKIVEDGEVLYDNLVKVDSISFGESKYSLIVPFTISLTAYEDKFFSGVYSGVLDPVNSISYDSTEDGNITISRTVSARGLNTSNSNSNAFANAVNYVQQLTGLNNVTLPAFINESGDINNLILTSQSESVNRLAATYSVSETYSYTSNPSGLSSDFYGNSLTYPLFKRATVNFQEKSAASPFNSIKISNEWSTNKTDLNSSYSSASMDYLRSKVSQYIQNLKDGENLYSDDGIISIIKANFTQIPNSGYNFYYNLNEDALAHKITFEINLTDDPTFDSEYGVYFKEDYSVSKDSLREIDEISYSFTIQPFGLKTITLDGYTEYNQASYLSRKCYNYYKENLLSGDDSGGRLEQLLLNKVSGFYKDILFDGVKDFSDQFKLLDLSKNDDLDNGTISIECKTNNAPKYNSEILKDVNFDLSVTPSKKIVVLNKSLLLNGHYLMTEHDTYYPRETISLNIQSVVNTSGNLESERQTVLSALSQCLTGITGQLNGSDQRIISQGKQFAKDALQASSQLDYSQNQGGSSYYFQPSPILYS
jgi:hypothetical protein